MSDLIHYRTDEFRNALAGLVRDFIRLGLPEQRIAFLLREAEHDLRESSAISKGDRT